MLLAILCAVMCSIKAQELYVYTEPASNMPAHSISAKATVKFIKEVQSGRIQQRYTPEIMLGLNKNWMVHGLVSFSNMYSDKLKWESVKTYAKYRFLSNDEVHRHFRMAAFAESSYSSNGVLYDELTLEGDHSGIQGGFIATQLLNKLAVSSTVSYLKVFSRKPKFLSDSYPYEAFNYSLSAGYLVLPVNYTSFKQTNLNLYAELLGQQTLDLKRHFIDIAPAIQLIFNSASKLNIGYRFQLNGNMQRMAEQSWLIGFERTFLDVIKNKR